MSHLGRWLTALVDEELDQAERDRVLNHLARCEGCLLEAKALRALKRRMAALGDTAAADAVTGKLLDLGRIHSVVGGAAPANGLDLSAYRRRRTRLGWKLVTGLAGVTLAVLGTTAFLLGGEPPGGPAPQVTPAVQTYWTQHSYDAGQVPGAGSGAVSSGHSSITRSQPTGSARRSP